MKKRLTILSAVSLMTLTALTGCGKGYSYDDGVMVYVNGTAYTTDELFDKFYNLDESQGVSAYYNALYDVAIEACIKKDQDMVNSVTNDLDDFLDGCETTAKTNGTTKAEEVEKALDTKGFETIEEYEDSLYLTAKTNKAKSEFTSDTQYEDNFIPNMVENFAPYHPRHILVKFSSSSSESLYQGSISDTDAQSLSSIISRIANGESFGSVAADSDDNSGSPSEMASSLNFGDTSIMTTQTSFVSEFKYGIYTYDQFFNTALTSEAKASQLSTCFSSDADNVADYTSLLKTQGDDEAYAYGIPYSAVLGLNYYYNKTTANNGLSVTDAQEYNYPRNVIYNNYFNNHGLSFIYLDNPSTESNGDANESKYYTADMYSALNSVSSSSVSHFDSSSSNVSGIINNLQAFTEADGTTHTTGVKKIGEHKVLVDELGHPIMATRAGTGSGDSGYQGIHLIVVQKDPYTTSESDMCAYYTLDKPSTSTSDDTLGTTYVGFVNSDSRSIYNDRVSALKTAVDSTQLHTDYDRFYYFLNKATSGNNDNGIKITVNSDIMDAVNAYIATKEGTTDESTKRTYEASWKTYTQKLSIFSDYSSRIEPMSGIAAFLNNDIDAYNQSIASSGK